MERRAAVRRTPDASETLASMRLRTGRELAVVDIGDGGALVEGTARLLPGTHVEVHVVTRDGRTLIRGRITRAWVFAVTAESLRYRAAVAFERHVNTAPNRVVATPDGAPSGPDGQRLPRERQQGGVHSTE